MVSDKTLASWLCKKEFPQTQKVVKQIKCLLGGTEQYVWIDSCGDSERVTEFCPRGSLNSFMWHFFWVSLASHFGLPGSQSIFGISQDPPMCVHASFSQDGFYQKGERVEHPFDLQGTFVCMCGWGGLLTLITRNMWSGQGPESSPNCPAVVVLEFQSTGGLLTSRMRNKWSGQGLDSPLTLVMGFQSTENEFYPEINPGGRGGSIYLLPQFHG